MDPGLDCEVHVHVCMCACVVCVCACARVRGPHTLPTILLCPALSAPLSSCHRLWSVSELLSLGTCLCMGSALTLGTPTHIHLYSFIKPVL